MELDLRDLGACPYATALALQEELLARRGAGDIEDQLILLEHPAVYTLGRGPSNTVAKAMVIMIIASSG
jgi:lipoate-protein ligase B